MKLFTIFTLLFCASSYALDDVKISLMGFAQSKSLYRGAVVWPKPSMMFGPSFSYRNKLFLRGPSLSYNFHDNKDEKLQFTLSARYSTDNKPMIDFSSHEEDYRNERGDSFNVSAKLKYKFGFRNLFYVGSSIVRDLSRYESSHALLSVGVPVLPFTTLKTKISFGTQESNQYAYGKEASSGLGHFELGLKYVFVKLPWNGIVMFDLDNYWVLQNQNRYANFIRGDYKNTKISTRWIWKL